MLIFLLISILITREKNQKIMKMDSYVTQFCKTLKTAITKSKYKEVLEKTEKFIHRQANHFQTCEKSLIIRMLYLESYSCHKIILKALMDTNSELDKFFVKIPLKIIVRNLRVTYKIVEKLLQSHQIIINFNEKNGERSPFYSYNRNNSDYQKPFSYLLETVTWALKDFTLVHNIKESDLRQKMLQIAKKLTNLTKGCMQKKKIRFRINELEVSVLIMVSHLKLGHYIQGFKYCQQLTTQIYQFLFHLNHKIQIEENPKYRKAIRKCNKLLLICFIQQTYFHILTNTYHPLQALTLLMKKVEKNSGPRQMIKYYDGYTYVVDQLQIIVKAHDELNKLLSRFECFQLNTIHSIVENNTIVNLSPVPQYLVNQSIKECQKNISIYQIGQKRISDQILQESRLSQYRTNRDEPFYRQTRFKKQAGFGKRRLGQRIPSFHNNHNSDDKKQKKDVKKMAINHNQITCGKTLEILKGRKSEAKKLKRLPSFQVSNGSTEERGWLAYQSQLSLKTESIKNLPGKLKVRLSGKMFEQTIRQQKNRLEQRKTYQGLCEIHERSELYEVQSIKELIRQKHGVLNKVEQGGNWMSQSYHKSDLQFHGGTHRISKKGQTCSFLRKSYKNLNLQKQVSGSLKSNQRRKITIYHKFVEVLLRNKQNLGLTSFACRTEAHLKRMSNRIEKKRLTEQKEYSVQRDSSGQNWTKVGEFNQCWGSIRGEGNKMQACMKSRDSKEKNGKQNRSHRLILDDWGRQEDRQRCFKRSFESIQEVSKKLIRKREMNKDKKRKCFFLL